MNSLSSYRNPTILILGFAISFYFKLSLITTGSPFVTIDDITTFEGGFLVWFGQAPPQRMFLESWICGLTAIATYVSKLIASGSIDALGINLIADAYRDFYGSPDLYVHTYRVVMILFDLATAFIVYLLAKHILQNIWQGGAAVLVGIMYLFSYNTFWCNIVARPDTVTAFFGLLGLLLYYKSDYGTKNRLFIAAAISLGLAAGMKLHGAFFAIFIALDLLRIHGLREGFSKVFWLALISLFFFCFAAGSLFADPLTYLKLRWANARDDISPWIQWGEQFITILRGTGWLIIPLSILSIWFIYRDRYQFPPPSQRIKSTIFLSICWLILFAAIRQLRAYWMLPALPLFYLSAVYALANINIKKITIPAVIIILCIMAGQSYRQVSEFKHTNFNELRTWLQENAKDQPFYILGYEAVALPKNTKSIKTRVAGLEEKLAKTREKGATFTVRHLQNWEERAQLMLFDMLNNRYEQGFEYYSFYSTPHAEYEQLLDLENITYFLVQQHFSLKDNEFFQNYIMQHYRKLTTLTGAGGGGSGLQYTIYKRM